MIGPLYIHKPGHKCVEICRNLINSFKKFFSCVLMFVCFGLFKYNNVSFYDYIIIEKMVRKHKQMVTPVKNTIISIYTAGDSKQSFCESVRNFYTIVLAYPENY